MNEKQKRIEVVEEILDSCSIDKQVRINEIAQILQSVEMPENQFVSAPNKQEALIEAKALYNAGYTQPVRQGDVVLTRGQFNYLLTGNIAKFVRETGGKVLSKEEYEEFLEEKWWLELRKGELIEEVKEQTAREILQELYNHKRFVYILDARVVNARVIEELAKKYGVEVE